MVGPLSRNAQVRSWQSSIHMSHRQASHVYTPAVWQSDLDAFTLHALSVSRLLLLTLHILNKSKLIFFLPNENIE